MSGNRYKTSPEEIIFEMEAPPAEPRPDREEKKERAERKPRERKERKKSVDAPDESELVEKKSWFGFLSDERFIRVSGISFIGLALFLLVPFISYLFTYAEDFDKVVNSGWLQLFLNPDTEVENWMGKLGAIVAHVFIYKGFGIAAIVFCLLSFLIGFRLLFGVDLLPWKKSLAWMSFSLIITSVTCGFIFSKNSDLLFLGGVYGFQISKWLVSAIGNAGTIALLFFVSIGFITAALNIKFSLPERKIDSNVLPEQKNETANIVAPVEMAAGNVFKEQTLNNPELELGNADVFEQMQEESKPFPLIMNEPVLETDNSIELSPVKNVEMEIAGSNGDVQLSIEQTIEEEEVESLNSESILEKSGPYDPTLDLSSYKFPELDLLENYLSSRSKLSPEELKAELESNKNKIVETLGHYGIEIDKIKATVGPTVTLFEIVPKAGVRISKIKNLEDDIALSLSALGIRIIAPMPGKGTIGIEVPNQSPDIVSMRSVIASEKFQNCEFDLPIALGKTISNEVFVCDLAKMPHLLMAGATGQGKSVGLNAVLVSLLYKKHPAQVKFVLVDPKKVELTLFKKIERHFLAKLPNEEEAIITDTKKVVNTLNSLCIEMDHRYELLKDAQVRNIKEYNARFIARKLNPLNGHHFLPYIVLVVDEFADLIMTAGREVETPIARLAQLARAIGIHLIIATQRPSVNIITGTIKANFPARVAFRVTSKIDSRTILDAGGADQLIGRGDMLLSLGADLLRVQCAFVDTPEVERITDYIGSQRGYSSAHLLPEYVGPDEAGGDGGNAMDADDRDALFDEAAKIIVQHQQGSASLLQRRLKLGYNRAGRLVDQLEAAGIIGPFEGSKPREVKVKTLADLEERLKV